MTTERIPDHPIEPLFTHRWSPRAYDATSMPASDLFSILEAARWAPSAYNIQPWRFLYSFRNDAHWHTYLSLLDTGNATWACNASALIVVLSDTEMPGSPNHPPKPSRYHRFDAGASWALLALQTTALGYQAHAMAGIDFGRSRQKLAVPKKFNIEIAIAIGKPASPSILPQALREREQPSQRYPLSDIAFAGTFPA